MRQGVGCGIITLSLRGGARPRRGNLLLTRGIPTPACALARNDILFDGTTVLPDHPWDMAAYVHTASQLPDRVSLLHKGGYPCMGSGCGDPIVECKFLRPSGNSPSRRHLTRGLLLCSRVTIHDLAGNVNRVREKSGGRLELEMRNWAEDEGGCRISVNVAILRLVGMTYFFRELLHRFDCGPTPNSAPPPAEIPLFRHCVFTGFLSEGAVQWWHYTLREDGQCSVRS